MNNYEIWIIGGIIILALLFLLKLSWQALSGKDSEEKRIQDSQCFKNCSRQRGSWICNDLGPPCNYRTHLGEGNGAICNYVEKEVNDKHK